MLDFLNLVATLVAVYGVYVISKQLKIDLRKKVEDTEPKQ